MTVSVALKVVLPPLAGAQLELVAMTTTGFVRLGRRGMPVTLQVLLPEAAPVREFAVSFQVTEVMACPSAAAVQSFTSEGGRPFPALHPACARPEAVTKLRFAYSSGAEYEQGESILPRRPSQRTESAMVRRRNLAKR